MSYPEILFFCKNMSYPEILFFFVKMEQLKEHARTRKIQFTQELVHEFNQYYIFKKATKVTDDLLNKFFEERNKKKQKEQFQQFQAVTQAQEMINNVPKPQNIYNALPFVKPSITDPIFNTIARDTFNLSTYEQHVHTISSLPSPYKREEYLNIHEFPLLNTITSMSYKYIIVHNIVIPQFANYNDTIFADFPEFQELRFNSGGAIVTDLPNNGVLLQNIMNNTFTANDIKLQPKYENQQHLSKITVRYKDRLLRNLNLPPANLPPIFSIYLNSTRNMVFFTFLEEHYMQSAAQIAFYQRKNIANQILSDSIDVSLYYQQPSGPLIRVYERIYNPFIQDFLIAAGTYPGIRLSDTLISFETPINIPYLCDYRPAIEFLSFYDFYYFITQNNISVYGNPFTKIGNVITYTEQGEIWSYNEVTKEIINGFGDGSFAIQVNDDDVWGFYIKEFTTHTITSNGRLEITLGPETMITNNVEFNERFLQNLFLQNRFNASYLKISITF